MMQNFSISDTIHYSFAYIKSMIYNAFGNLIISLNLNAKSNWHIQMHLNSRNLKCAKITKDIRSLWKFK